MPARKVRNEQGAENDKGGVGAVLTNSKVGTFEVPVSKLVLTNMGRSLRDAGVKQLRKSMEQDGWLSHSMPIVTLVHNGSEHAITQDNARNFDYRVVDENHRVAALRSLDEQRGIDSIIFVRVHRNLGERIERILADRE